MPETTIKAAGKGAVKQATAGGKKPATPAAAPARQDESDEEEEDDDDEVVEEKPFAELSQPQRDEVHKQRADELTTDPIYHIRFEPYRVLAEETGAVKISKTADCHYYKFEGKKDEKFFLWAFVRFGVPVTMEAMERHDEDAKNRALRAAVRDAGIYDEILAEFQKETRRPKGTPRNTTAPHTAKKPNKQGARNRSHGGGRFRRHN